MSVCISDNVYVRTHEGHRAVIAQVITHDPITDTYVRATGEAIRHPEDKHDAELAKALAVGRALENVGRKLLKRANGRVKCNDDNRNRTTVPIEQVGCHAIKLDGEPCGFSAKPGQWFCGHHS